MNNGIVTLSESDLYYTGGTIIFDHGHGISTLYMHLEKIFVKVGDHVKKGDVIATVGSSGRSTGPHLHFETRLRTPSSANCSLPYLDPTSRGRVNPYCFLN